MTTAKDHHILPQMYLKQFVDPDTPPGMKPYVWRYDVAERRWQRKGPGHRLFFSRYYYVFQNKNNQLVNALEPALSAIESSGAVLMRKLASRTPLTEREEQDFSLFIPQLMFRMPKSRAATASWLDRKGQEFVAGQIQYWRENPEEFEKVVRRYRHKSGESADISIEDVERSKPKLEPRDGTLLGYSMMPTIRLAVRLLIMNCQIFFTDAEHWLIISDHPCELHWPDEMTEDEIIKETFRGFLIKGMKFHVPLTPNMLFAAFDNGSDRAFGEFLPNGMVIELNQRIAARTEQFIVSPKPSFLGDDLLVGSA